MASLLSYQVFITLAIVFVNSSSAQLNHTFYSSSCPNVFQIVEGVVRAAINKEARMGASLLRLHFHDCFVNGCDGSVLLDDAPSFTGEKTAGPNNNSIRGFDVVDNIKNAVEKQCKGVVSCADILAIAAMKSVSILGGVPGWATKLGRRDSRTANKTLAQSAIPSPNSNLTQLIDIFRRNNLSKQDLVALSGSHTIGLARCTSFRARIYNETNINSQFAQERRANCPRTSGSGDDNLAGLDTETSDRFDNNYYKNLVNKQGLLHSDQQLYSNGAGLTDSFVSNYANNPIQFYQDFAAAMLKMGDISPLTGSNGEIRKNCRLRN